MIISLVLMSSTNAAEFLSSTEQATVLEEIDNICGDTWCEGDFDFSFNEIKCDSESSVCEIEMELFEGCYEEDESLCNETIYSGTCSIGKLAKYSDLVDESRRWRSLNDDFYFRLSDCITELEEEAYSIFDF